MLMISEYLSQCGDAPKRRATPEPSTDEDVEPRAIDLEALSAETTVLQL